MPALAFFKSQVDDLEGIVHRTYNIGSACFRVITVSKVGRRMDGLPDPIVEDEDEYPLQPTPAKGDASATIQEWPSDALHHDLTASSRDSSASSGSVTSSVGGLSTSSSLYTTMSGLSSKVRYLPSSFDLMLALGGTLFDSHGQRHLLKDILQPEGTTVCIFRRHYWCALCSEYCHMVAKLPYDKLVASNIKIVLIGCGSYELIEPHQKRHGSVIESYTNPTNDIYGSLGMYRSLDAGPDAEKGEYITQTMLENVVESTKNGLQMRKYPGKFTQLGGEFVFEKFNDEAVCTYASRMTTTRNHGKLSEVLEAAGCDLRQVASL